MKILIAEDDAVSRRLLFKVLSKYGECDLVVDGIEAVDAFLLAQNEEPYEVICLDIMMPKLDGIRVLKTIRELERQTQGIAPAKIIMLTALDEKEVVDDAFSKGADAYATKPLDLDKLEEVLKKFQ